MYCVGAVVLFVKYMYVGVVFVQMIFSAVSAT